MHETVPRTPFFMKRGGVLCLSERHRMKWKSSFIGLVVMLIFPANLFADISTTQRIDIITAYGKILENRKYTVGRTSDLPFSKEVIRKAIVQELLNPTYKSFLRDMETAYLLSLIHI